MSLRTKLALALSGLAVLAALTIGLFSFRTTSSVLRGEIDGALARGASYVEHEALEHPLQLGSITFGARPGVSISNPIGNRNRRGPSREFDELLVQVIDPDGSILVSPDSGTFPVDLQALDRAQRKSRWSWSTIESADDDRLRVVTVPIQGGAVQLARSLDDVDIVLRKLVRRTLTTVVGVGLAAALIGWIFARRVTSRLASLTAAAEIVTATGNLTVAVPAGGSDEAGRLGTAFDHMLGSLAASRDAQQRLVQDAGHELRTPLTSLRTNISVLRRNPNLAADQREQVLSDLESESKELTVLVNDLVDAAADQSSAAIQRVILADELARICQRAERRSGRKVALQADDSEADLQPGALDRSVGNLLDNAIKFDASMLPIEVECKDGSIRVRDHGPGFDADDLPHVFDRFFRSTTARGKAGSGLGLGIVKDIAERHQGSVTATNHPDGGAMITITFPAT